MRVSKVKVVINREKGSRMVLMNRSSKEGSLVYDDKTGKADGVNRTTDILPEKKKDSFALSIQNQTIPKLEIVKKHLGKNSNKKVHESLSAIIKGICTGEFVETKHYYTLGNITEAQIKGYLSHRFQDDKFEYLRDKEKKTFCLAGLLIESIKQKSVAPMEPYREWVKWTIENKSKKLIKSIQNNHITIDEDSVEIEEGYLSPRKKALLAWEAEFIERSVEPELIRLYEIHQLYQIERLMESLRSVAFTIGEKGIDQVNEYHRNLKKALQKHQQEIFGSKASSNEKNRNNVHLYTYNLEVVKYLEHYFPIKRSKRKTTVESIQYYLKTDVIKNTIRKQIENAVRSNLIRQGKYVHHNLNASTVSSTSLSEIKADEGFSQSMITQCAFAANNIRNIVDPKQTKDILGKRYFEKSLKLDKRLSPVEKVFPSFFNLSKEENSISDKDNVYLWAIRGAVQQIRNNVIHYKKNALDVIFDVRNFEYKKSENKYGIGSYNNDTKFGALLQKEKKEAPKALALQLMTGNVLEYYPMELLKSFFTRNTLSIYRSSVPFAPGFKKVMKGGGNYQNADKGGFYNLGIDYFLPKEQFSEEGWNARYFFLKLIYNNLFLPIFTNDVVLFRETINKVLEINEANKPKQASGKAVYERAFADISKMEKNDTIAKFMAYLQSYAMIEANKKAENHEVKDPRFNFEKFLLQTFIKGFNDYLNSDKSFEFIQRPTLQFNNEDTNKADKRNEWKTEIEPALKFSITDIDSTNNAHISFFVFAKLLDAAHLSDLRNELIKYCQSQSYRPDDTAKIKHLFAIIELCLLSVDTYPIKRQIVESSSSENTKFAPFLEAEKKITDYGNLFTQSDDETMVLHRAIEKGYKYGTRRVLQEIINSKKEFRITTDEYKEWSEEKLKIEEQINRREQLHEAWEEYERNKRNNNKHDKRPIHDTSKIKSSFTPEMAKQYENLCNEIDRYNWLDNKLHLQHLNRLHNLTIDILGRMAGFTSIFERDLQYYSLNNSKMNALLCNSEDQKPFDFSGQLPRFTDGQNKILFNTMLSADYKDIRNCLAHFNYLNAFEERQGGSPLKSYSLIELINGLRSMLSYDRKLRNAVPKAFIKIFEKYGMDLKFEISSDVHQLKVASITPRPIKHLGKYKIGENYIHTDMVNKSFCSMCVSLLGLKK